MGVQDQSMADQGSTLCSLAESAGNLVRTMFQKIADELLVIDQLMQEADSGQIQLGTVPSSDPSYYVNAKLLSENKTNNSAIVPGFDPETNQSTARSMWMVIGPKDGVDHINLGSWQDVPEDYKKFYNTWLIALPYTTSVLDRQFVTTLYAPYHKPIGNAEGFFVEYPLFAQWDVYVEYISPRGDEPYFKFSTRPWYKQTDIRGVLHATEFIYPYKFTSTQSYGYSACVLTTSSGTDKGMVCLDYEPTFLKDYIETVGAGRQISFFVLDLSNYKVLIYSNKNNLDDDITNITQVEFGLKSLSTEEAIEFDNKFRSFVEDFDPKTNFMMSYTKNEADYILTISKFEVMVSWNSSVPKKQFIIGVNMPQAIIIDDFESMKDRVLRIVFFLNGLLLALTFLLLIVAPILVSWVASAITTPIENLKKILLQISGDYMEEEEFNEKKARKRDILSRLIPDIDSLSRELENLNKRFTVLQKAISFARIAESASTDAEALMNYAQALSIYRDLKNLRGIGSISFNLGNIHFKHERYDEALSYYKESINCSQKELENLKDIESKVKRNIDEAKSVSKVLNRGKNDKGMSLEIHLKVKAEVEESHCTRTYQMAQCMLMADRKDKYKRIDFANNQHIRSLLFETLTMDLNRKKNPYRVILCLLDIADTYIDIEHYEEAKKTIKEANEKLRVYEEEYVDFDDESSVDYKIPPANLRQKCLYIMGKLSLAQDRKRDACVLFTRAIEHGETYDPTIRRACLTAIRDIFRQQGLIAKAPNVDKILALLNNKRKDIVILLDYSQSMIEEKKIVIAVANILRLFDKFIKGDDRVSFIRFNMNCDIVFTLVEKSKSTTVLRRNIEESTKPSGGTAFYNAIYEALKIFQRAEPRNSNKWIIALTDGDDNESRITFEQVYKKLQRTPDVNLIIIGLGLQAALKKKLSYLCRSTTDGLFLDSPTQEDLNVAFQALSNIVFGFETTIENEKITF